MTTHVNKMGPFVSQEERRRRLHEVYSYLIALGRQKKTGDSTTAGDHAETAVADTPAGETNEAVGE